jgi:hypothetical protein
LIGRFVGGEAILREQVEAPDLSPRIQILTLTHRDESVTRDLLEAGSIKGDFNRKNFPLDNKRRGVSDI